VNKIESIRKTTRMVIMPVEGFKKAQKAIPETKKAKIMQAISSADKGLHGNFLKSGLTNLY
jgi:hypothetical protein